LNLHRGRDLRREEGKVLAGVGGQTRESGRTKTKLVLEGLALAGLEVLS
jgi:hypothetical protein